MEMKDIAQEMKTQDNRATARPYIIVLQERQSIVVPEGHGGDVLQYWSGRDCESFDSMEEFERVCLENEIEGEEKEKYKNSLEPYWLKYYWEDKNWFFTYKGYERHLELNRHNYGKIRNYVKYVHRNPEFEKVYNMILDTIEPKK